MLPTFEPREDFLRAALAGVLDQDWAGVDLQVEIVDDRSTRFDPAAFVAELSDPRVAYHRQPERAGLGGNWNTCIGRATGDWIHILHQDDLVHPGFYARMEEGIGTVPDLGAAFCQGFVIDESGRRLRRTCRVPDTTPGILEDWVQHVFVELAIQTPTIVVRRDVYVASGGFDTALRYTVDWEMWKRIAVRHPIWFEPAPLASYRVHGETATRKLQRTGANIREIEASIDASAALLPEAVAPDVQRRAREHYTRHAVSVAWQALSRDHDPGTAWSQLVAARRLASRRRLLRTILGMVGERLRPDVDPGTGTAGG